MIFFLNDDKKNSEFTSALPINKQKKNEKHEIKNKSPIASVSELNNFFLHFVFISAEKRTKRENVNFITFGFVYILFSACGDIKRAKKSIKTVLKVNIAKNQQFLDEAIVRWQISKHFARSESPRSESTRSR